MRDSTRNSYVEGLEKVVAHVMAHPDNESDPRALANIAGFSIFHFHRIFRGMMGETLGEFARRIRLEYASWRISQGANVGEVAFECGFESHEAFTRSFKAAYGTTPSACRGNKAFNFVLPNPTGTHFVPLGQPIVLRCLMRESNMNVEIKEVAGLRAASIRHNGAYWQIGSAFGQLGAWAAQKGLPPGDRIAIFYDNPEVVPQNELRSDACIVVAQDYAVEGEGIGIVHIQPGTYAVTTYTGPYSGLPDAWNKFAGEWLPSSGYKTASMGEFPPFEKYINTCDNTDPEKLQTELYMAIVS